MRRRYQKRLEKAREVLEQALRDLQAARMIRPNLSLSELKRGIRRAMGKCEPDSKPVITPSEMKTRFITGNLSCLAPTHGQASVADTAAE